MTPPPPADPGSLRWLVTGAAGMVGTEVVGLLAQAGADVTAAGRPDLDITDPDAVADAVASHDVVVNGAAWTAVDDAESHEADAFAANATGPSTLARACAATGAGLVHLSTDYVFDGTAGEPYPEDAPLRPVSAYGRTKAAGEWAVAASGARAWVLRTAWVYAAGRPCFPRTMARLARERETLDVVADQVGQPTWAREVARTAVAVVRHAVPPGTYHATAGGQVSWHGLAQAVLTHLGADPARVRPTTAAAFPRPAPRPAWSVLGHDGWRGTGVPAPRPWQDQLADAVADGLLADEGAPDVSR